MLKQLLALSLLLVAAPLGLATADDAGPAVNQKCGVSTKGNKVDAGTELAGYGASKDDALADALGNASGVVCDICDNGIQCEREVLIDQSTYIVGGSYTEGDDGSICFMGEVVFAKLTVTCHDC